MTLRFIKRTCFVTSMILSLAVFNSCLKNRSGETDFSNLQDYVIFQNGGTVNFTAANINAGATAPDTVTLSAIVTLASKNVASSPLTVKVGLDDTKRTEYNTTNNTSYQAFPSNTYKILNPTVTIPAGQNYATVKIEIYPRKIDQTVSYMLPLTITDASGKNLSGNLNTVYYHFIGNPLAGTYTWNFTRWSTPDSTTAPDGNSFTGHTTSFLPISATAIEVKSGYFIGPRYQLSFTNTNGVLSNFKLKFNPDDAAALVAGGVTVVVPPTILIADPATKHFRFYYTTATRAVIDEYIKQ